MCVPACIWGACCIVLVNTVQVVLLIRWACMHASSDTPALPHTGLDPASSISRQAHHRASSHDRWSGISRTCRSDTGLAQCDKTVHGLPVRRMCESEVGYYRYMTTHLARSKIEEI